MVAMLTYIVVELREVRDFFLNFESISAFFSDISFDMLIDLIIDSFMNFILAIAWPWYWLSEITGPFKLLLRLGVIVSGSSSPLHICSPSV